MRRSIQIGILALAVAAGASRTPAGAKIVSSARSFQRQYCALKGAPSMGPIERLVLSLAKTS